MANAAERYCSDILRGLAYSGTWLPSNAMKVGDVGIIRNGIFERQRNIRAMGVRFSTIQASASQDLQYTSDSGIMLSTKAAGKLSKTCPNIPKARAGLAIEFDRQGGVVFSATGCVQRQVQDPLMLRAAVLDLYNRQLWDLDWSIVTEVIVAERATILVSDKAGAKVELAVDAAANAGTIELADATVSATLSHFDNMAVRLVAKASLTPLYRASKLQKRIFSRRAEFRPAGRRGVAGRPPSTTQAHEQLRFESVAPYSRYGGREWNR